MDKANCRRKGRSMRATLRGFTTGRPLTASVSWLVSLCVMLGPVVSAGDLPTGAQVVHGQVGIMVNGTLMQIDQATQNAILNWESFSIGSGYGVHVNQPSASSAMLSRVIGADQSRILGALQANGIFYLVNRNGVFFGPDSTVDVGALIASTLDITDEDFLAAKQVFQGDSSASIMSNGRISAEKFAVLLARSLSNSGSIAAPHVEMASAGRMVVDRVAGGRIMVDFSRLMGDVVNEGAVDVSGKVGGKAALIGKRVAQLGRVSADGSVGGGGSVRIHADDVIDIGADSKTSANAGSVGDGGQVIAFSPEMALFRKGAVIEAKGGATAGDGGFVEVSGQQHVEIDGRVDAGASNGEAGTFLIDPTDIQIISAVGDLPPDLAVNPQTFTPDKDTNTVQADTIEGYLESGTSVTLDTTAAAYSGPLGGAITQDADAPIKPGAGVVPVTLTLNARDHIELNGGVDGSDLGQTLAVELNAADPAQSPVAGTGLVDINAAIDTNGGSLTITGDDFDNTGTISTGDGPITLDLSNNVTVNAAIDTNLLIQIEADSSIAVADNITSRNSNIILDAGNTAGKTVQSTGSAVIEATNGYVSVDAYDVNLLQVKASGQVPGDTYGIRVIANNDVTVSAPWITDTTDNVNQQGDIQVTAGNEITVSATVTAEDAIAFTATASDINLDAALTAGTTVDVIAGDDILNSSGNPLAAQTGNIELDAGNVEAVAEVNLQSTVTAGGDILIGQTVPGKDVNTSSSSTLTADDNVRIAGRNVNIAASVTSGNDGGEDDIVINATAPIAQTAGTIDANDGSVSIISTGTSGLGGTVSLVDIDATGDNQVVGVSTSAVAGLQFVSIQVRGLGDVTVAGIDATGTAVDPNTQTSNVEIISDTGNVLLGDVDAVNTVFVQAASGTITDNNAGSTNVMATKLDARAQDLVGDAADSVLNNPGATGFDALETAVGDISAVTTGANADVAIDNVGAVTVSNIEPSAGQPAALWIRSTDSITVTALAGLGSAAENDSVALIATSGNVTLPDSGDAATTGAADIETTGTVRLEAAAGQVAVSGGTIFAVMAGDVLLKAQNAQTIATAITNLDATVTGSGNALTIQEAATAAGLTLTDLDGDNSSIQTNGGDIAVTVNDTDSNLVVDGSVTPGTDPNFIVDARGADISLTVAGAGSGAIQIENGSTVTTDSTDAQNFGTLSLGGRLVVDGDLHATSGRTLALSAPAAAMALNAGALAAGGDVTLDGKGANLTIPNGAELRISAGGGKLGNLTVQNAGTVDLATPVAMDGSFTVSAVTGTLTLDDVEFDANRDGTGALSITTDDTAATFLGDLVLNGTIDGNGQTATFSIDGSVTAGANGLITDVGGLIITAAENIGTAARSIPIGTTQIDVETTEANQLIALYNTPGADVTAFEATTAGGDVTYSQNGDGLAITGNGVVTSGGALSIDPPDDVAVNAAINLGTGRYQQTNTGSYTVAAGISITAGDIDIVADSDHDGLAADGVSVAGFVQTDGAGQILSSSSVGIEAANIEVNDIQATTGAITLRATGNGPATGTIAENGGAAAGADLQAQTVNLISGATIDADVDVTMALNVTSGGAVNVEDTAGGLPIGSISANAGAANVILVSADGVSDAAADVEADITAADLNVTAAGAVDVDTDVATLTVDVAAGDITIDETDEITLTSLDTDAGAIAVNATGAVEVNVVAATGAVAVNAQNGAITDTGGNSDVDGATISLVAGNGDIGAAGQAIAVDATAMVNANASQNNGSIWLANSAGVFPAGLIDAGSGDIATTAQAGFTDGNGALTNLHGNDATVTIAAPGAFDADTDLDTITIAGATTVNVDGVDGLTVNSIAATGQVDVTLATGGLVLTDGAVAAAGQTVNLTADWIDSPIAANGTVEVAGATITMLANDGGIGAVNAIELTGSTVVNANSSAASGDVKLTSIGAAADLPLGNVNAGSGDIVLVSGRHVLDANALGANLTGSAVEITATGTVGTAAEGLETSIAALDVNTGATSVDIEESGGINLVDIDASGIVDVDAAAGDIIATDVASGGNAIDLNAASGSVLVDVINAGAATVAVTATGGAIVEADGDVDVDITGTTATLTATGGGIGAGNAIETELTGVVFAAAGAVGISEVAAGTALAVQGTSGGGDISAETAAGDITLTGAVDAGAGDVVLAANGGALTGNDNLITGNALAATAANAIGIDTTVATVTAASATAGVDIDETDALTVGQITAATTVVIDADAGGVAAALDGTADVIAPTSLTVTAAGTISLETDSPVLTFTTDDPVDATASDITITSLDADPVAMDATTAEGSIDVTATAALNSGTVTAGTDGDVVLTTRAGALTLTGVTTAIGNTVALNSAAGLADTYAGGTGEAVVADTLSATAAGAVDLDTVVNTASATTSAAGTITLDNTGALTVTNVTSNDGTVDISAGGTLTVQRLVAGDVGASGDDDVLLDTTAGDISVGTITSADDITINAAGAITDAAGVVTGDLLTMDAGGAIGAAGTPLTTAVATIDAETSAAGAIVIDEFDGVVLQDVDTADGDITVSAGGGIVITTIDGDDDTVNLTSGGTITDNDDTVTDITAGTANLVAETGVGGPADPLDLIVTNISAHTTAGVVNLANAPTAAAQIDGLSTGDASDITYAQSALGLTVAGDISSAGGNVLIDSPAGLAINADVGTIESGTLTLEAAVGGVVTQSAGAIISTDAGALTISGDAGGSAASFTMSDDSTVGSTSGLITIIADAMTLDNVTTAGDVVLDADNADGNLITIPPTNPANGLITADHLQIRVTNNDTIDIAMKVWKLSISGGKVIKITQHGHLVIGDITSGPDADVSLTSVTEGITEDDDAAADITIPFATTGGLLTLNAATVLDMDTNVTNFAFAVDNIAAPGASNVNIDELAIGGALNVHGTMVGGDVDISTEDGSITVDGALGASGGGRLRLDANETAAATVANVVVDAGAVDAGSGELTLEAADSVTLTAGGTNTLTTTGVAALTATSGAITGNDNLIAAGTLNAAADGAIAVDTTVGTVNATSTTAGIDIDETDALSVGLITAATTVIIDADAGGVTSAGMDGVADIVAPTGITVTAAGGIALETDSPVLGLTTDAAGNVDVINVTSGAPESLTLNATVLSGTLSVETDDDLAVGDVIGGGASGAGLTRASLSSTGGAITDSDAGPGMDVTADSIVFSALDGIGDGNAIEVTNSAAPGTASSLAGNTTNGDIELSATGALTVTTVGGVAGLIAGGDITVDAGTTLAVAEDITALGIVDLSALNGSIATTPGSLITAAALNADANANAADGITLNTTVTDAVLDVGVAGTATLVETDAINVVDANGQTLNLTAGGAITGTITVDTLTAITTDGSITLTDDAGGLVATSVIAGGDARDVTLLSQAGTLTVGYIEAADDTVTLTATVGDVSEAALTDAGVDVFAETLVVTADNAAAATVIALDTEIEALTADADGHADSDITIDEIDSILLTSVTAGDDVTISAGDAPSVAGRITVMSVTAGGTATLDARAEILDDVDAGTDVAASDVVLIAGTGIGSGRMGDAADLDVNAGTLTATVTAKGDINIEEADSATVTATTADGNVDIQAASGSLAVAVIDADQFSDNAVSLFARDDILDHAPDTITDIFSGANTNLTVVDGDIGNKTNPLEIQAGDKLNFSAMNPAARGGFWVVGTGLAGGSDTTRHVRFAGVGKAPPGMIFWNGSIIGGTEAQLRDLFNALRQGSFYTILADRLGSSSVFVVPSFFIHDNVAVQEHDDVPLIQFLQRGVGRVAGLPDGDETVNIQWLTDSPYSGGWPWDGVASERVEE